MKKWFAEIKIAKDDWDKREALFFDNPDGRRWVGYKTGTWIIDRAINKTRKSIEELTIVPADGIIKMAGLK